MTTIARYKFGYSTDEWGMNRSLSLIADAAGDVCRFSDVEALQARVAELTAELANTKEVEFPRRVEKVAEGWKTKCEALQARCAELEDKYLVEKGMRRLATDERDALAAELAAIKAREPVAWRWRMNGQWHYGPEPLFKDGFTTQEPLYDKPIPPVQDPLSDEEVDALGDL